MNTDRRKAPRLPEAPDGASAGIAVLAGDHHGDEVGQPRRRETPISSYRDLEVWQEAMDLVADVYAVTQRLPADERFGLASQMRRSSVSVPSNIAEGWGRGSTREYLQFIRYARGSLKELETQWHLAARIGYVTPDEVAPLDKRSERLGKRLLTLIRSLSSRI